MMLKCQGQKAINHIVLAYKGFYAFIIRSQNENESGVYAPRYSNFGAGL